MTNITPQLCSSIFTSILKDGYATIPCAKNLQTDCDALLKRFYVAPAVERIKCIATAESGVLGYYPSEQEACLIRSAQGGKNITVFSGKRKRGYSSFDYLTDFSPFQNCPLFKCNNWPDSDLNLKGMAIDTSLRVQALGKTICMHILDLCVRRYCLDPINSDIFNQSINISRLLKYCVAENGGNPLISKPHTDYEFLSFIISDKPGLQVKKGVKPWFTIPNTEKSLIILPGDMLEVITNREIKSTLHRVKVTQGQRHSFILFFGLRPDFPIKLGDGFPTSFSDHIYSMLLRGSPHLKESQIEIKKNLNLTFNISNPFKPVT